MRLVYLSDEFYDSHIYCTEIEQKPSRPHARIVLDVEGLTFAVPFRSNINHPYAFFTDKRNKCGIDFSKSVVIVDENREIRSDSIPHLRQNEFNALKGKDKRLENGLKKYLREYQKAKSNPFTDRAETLLSCSTLQYFEDIIFAKADCDEITSHE